MAKPAEEPAASASALAGPKRKAKNKRKREPAASAAPALANPKGKAKSKRKREPAASADPASAGPKGKAKSKRKKEPAAAADPAPADPKGKAKNKRKRDHKREKQATGKDDGLSATQERNARKRAAKKRLRERAKADPSLAYLDKPLRAPTVAAARRFFLDHLWGEALEVHLGPVQGWRTEAKLAVRAAGASGELAIGLFLPGTHEVSSVDGCPAHHPAINVAIKKVRKACKSVGVRGYDERRGEGDLRYLKFDVERATGKVQLTLVWHAASREVAGAKLDALVQRLAPMPLWHSIWANFNPAGPSVSRIFAFEQEAWQRLSGQKQVLREQLSSCSIPYELPHLCFPPYVFRQANLCAFGGIVASLRRFVAPGSRVVELYGGVGTIGLHLADLVKSLVCSDENPHNEECFRLSVKGLPPELQNRLSYKRGDAASQLASLPHADILIVDPPRKGLDDQVVTTLLPGGLASQLRLVLYVSCGFPALQRDVARLQAGGWTVTHAEGFVLFPGADHIETFCVLER